MYLETPSGRAQQAQQAEQAQSAGSDATEVARLQARTPRVSPPRPWLAAPACAALHALSPMDAWESSGRVDVVEAAAGGLPSEELRAVGPAEALGLVEDFMLTFLEHLAADRMPPDIAVVSDRTPVPWTAGLLPAFRQWWEELTPVRRTRLSDHYTRVRGGLRTAMCACFAYCKWHMNFYAPVEGQRNAMYGIGRIACCHS